jgi:hypothetical protein
MRWLVEECGFDKKSMITGSWGNRKCVVANFKKWATYKPFISSLVNEPEFPLVIWVLAEKTGGN